MLRVAPRRAAVRGWSWVSAGWTDYVYGEAQDQTDVPPYRRGANASGVEASPGTVNVRERGSGQFAARLQTASFVSSACLLCVSG
jgi:hypothetical protein